MVSALDPELARGQQEVILQPLDSGPPAAIGQTRPQGPSTRSPAHSLQRGHHRAVLQEQRRSRPDPALGVVRVPGLNAPSQLQRGGRATSGKSSFVPTDLAYRPRSNLPTWFSAGTGHPESSLRLRATCAPTEFFLSCLFVLSKQQISLFHSQPGRFRLIATSACGLMGVGSWLGPS
jgi:hypothetical protein